LGNAIVLEIIASSHSLYSTDNIHLINIFPFLVNNFIFSILYKKNGSEL